MLTIVNIASCIALALVTHDAAIQVCCALHLSITLDTEAQSSHSYVCSHLV